MLRIEQVSYAHRGNWLGRAKEILHNLSLEVRAGESFGFLGHNGAGKTTTIKCILGLLIPSNGKIHIGSHSSISPEARRFVGYVPEQPYFYDYLTVNETLSMFAALSDIPSSIRKERIKSVLNRLFLEDRAHQRLRTLSKGILQRVALAQALLCEPQLLILDEPFSGLDPIGRREFREIIQEERKKGTTVFICTHVLNDVERLCDRVSILVRGELQGVFEITSLPNKGTIYQLDIAGSLGETDIFSSKSFRRSEKGGISIFEFSERVAAESALRAALNGGLEILSYGVQKGSLEDLFNEIVMQRSNPPLKESRS